MPFAKELSHLIEEQINRSVEHKTTSMDSSNLVSRSGGDEDKIAQLEANLQKLGEKFTSYLSSQKNSKRNTVDYGLTVIALHELRLAVTAGRAIFTDIDNPVDVPYTYLQLSSAGTERQIRYIYLEGTGVVLESTTDPTNIGTGYIPLAMVDVWTEISEITQDKIKDIRPMIGAVESNSNAQSLELNGNVTLYSPDTGNDSFIVSATNPAGLKVNVTSGRALVDGEMLNAEGGLLDLTSHCKMITEFIAFSDGTTKRFNLYHKLVSNVAVYVNDMAVPVTVDAANGSIIFDKAPIQDVKITVSYTFSGNYMLVFLVEKAQTNDGKSFGVIGWKVGTNRTPSEPPDLATYQHAIAKVDMSSSIMAITDAIIDNSYEVKNLTQYDLQYGGKLDGSSLKAGGITLGNLDSSIQSNITIIDQLKTELDKNVTDIEKAQKSINDTQSDLNTKYTELTEATSELSIKDQSLISIISDNKTEMENKLNSAVSQIQQTTDNISTTIISNKKDADDKNQSAIQQISQIQQSFDNISSTVSVNKSDADSRISTLKQNVDGISSIVSADKIDADSKISMLQQTANSIASTVASNKTDIEGKLSSAVSQIKQTTDGISTTVANNKTDIESKLTLQVSAIKQTSDSISSNVSTLASTVELNRENLLHPEEWYLTDDANNKFSYFSALTSSKNEIIKEIGPFGIPVNCWKVTDVGHHNSSGGYNTQQVNAKDIKTYRFIVYFKKKIDQEGMCYFGCDSNNTANLGGTKNANPYFWYGDLPNLDQWYLLVGYVYGKDYTGTSYGGMYDMNGNKIVDFTDYKMLAGATLQQARHYLYCVTAGNPELYIYAPRMEEVDGTELSIDQFFPNLATRIIGNTSQIMQTANSVSTVIAELGKPIDQCSYTAITQAKDAINLRVKSSDYNGQNIVSQINVSPAGTIIDGKMLHVTGQTVFDDNVIVGRMLQAGSVSAANIVTGAVTADKISATLSQISGQLTAGQITAGSITADKLSADTLNLTSNGKTLNAGSVTLDSTGLKVLETNGAYTKFDANGLTWTDSNGRANGGLRRTAQGIATNGQYVRLNWERLPFVILSPKSMQTTITGYTSSNLKIICEPYGVTSAGFYIRALTQLDSASSTTSINGSLLYFYASNYVVHPAYTPITVTTPGNVNTISVNIALHLGGTRSNKDGDTISLSGALTLNIYYKSHSSSTWILAVSQYYSGGNTNSSYNGNIASNLVPDTYDIMVSVANATVDGSLLSNSDLTKYTSATFVSYSVNGGGTVSSTGTVSFLAMETDGNSYYTLE